MSFGFRQFINGLRFVPKTSTTVNVAGDVDFNTTNNKLTLHDGTVASPIVTEASTATLTNKSLSDSTTAIVDASDATKQIKFDTAGTTGTSTTLLSSQTTNKTLTFPDATDTLVGKATTDTLTNKTLSGNIATTLISGAATNTFPTTTGILLSTAAAVTIGQGGTGQTTATTAFNALSPMTTGGDLIYGGTSGAGTRLANGTSGQILTSQGTTLAPIWATPITQSQVTSFSSSQFNQTSPTSNTFYAIANAVTVSLAAGTWSITLQGTAYAVNTAASTASGVFIQASTSTSANTNMIDDVFFVGENRQSSTSGAVIVNFPFQKTLVAQALGGTTNVYVQIKWATTGGSPTVTDLGFQSEGGTSSLRIIATRIA